MKTATKLHDFLMNPKSRPDLQTPEGQRWLRLLDHHYQNTVGPRLDPLTPWLTREWKKGQIGLSEDGEIGHAYYMEPLGGGDRIPGQFGDAVPSRRIPLTGEHLGHWADFLDANHPLRRGLGDIMRHDVLSFHDRVKDWDQAMEQATQRRALEGGQVVHTTPEGYTVRKLTTPKELEAEGEAMGHCVGGYHPAVERGDSLIYSLRDPQGFPHATTEIAPQWYERKDGLGTHRNQSRSSDDNGYMDYPIPHGGEVVQIQGRSNQEPKDEYKQQLAHWFRGFPPKDRPTHGDEGEAVMYDDDGYSHYRLDHPDLIPQYQRQFGGLNPTLSPEEDKYGLLRQRPRLDSDYEGLLDNIAPRTHSYYDVPDAAHIKSIWLLAQERGEIPQLAKALEGYQEKQNDNFDQWMDQNWEMAPRYPDPDSPHGWEDEEGEDAEEGQGKPYWTPRGSGDGYGGQGDRVYNPEEAEKEYQDAYGEWERQHPGMNAVSQLYTLINPHFGPHPETGEPGYWNEPPQAAQPTPTTFSKTAAFDPRTLPLNDYDDALREFLHNPTRWTYKHRETKPNWGYDQYSFDVAPIGAGATHEWTNEWDRTRRYGYDPELTEPVQEPGDLGRFNTQFHLKPHPEWREDAYRDDNGNVRGFREEVPSDPAMLYRGLSHEEWEDAKERGYFQSNGTYNIGSEPEGSTMFSTDPGQAHSYAVGFAPWHRKPGFTAPSYVIGIPRPKDAFPHPGFRPDDTNETVVPGQVPFNQVQQAWQFRPYVMQHGDLDLRTENWGKTYMGQPHTGPVNRYAYRPMPLGRTSHVRIANALYKRWVFSPASGQVSLADNSGDPLDVKYHTDLARALNEPNLVHGYAYRIGNGWRLFDWDSKPLEDNYIVAQVMRALQADQSASGPQNGSQAPSDEDWDRMHVGLPS